MVIVSSWPRDFPGLGTSAQRLAARISLPGGQIYGSLVSGAIDATERVGPYTTTS